MIEQSLTRGLWCIMHLVDLSPMALFVDELEARQKLILEE